MMVGQKSRFWMWVDGGYRLLISVLPTSDSRGVVAVTLGDQSLMDYLGLQPSESNLPASEIEATPQTSDTSLPSEPTGELGGESNIGPAPSEPGNSPPTSEEMGGQPVDRGQSDSGSFFVPPPNGQKSNSSL